MRRCPLKLRDLNGIARSMETRLHAAGIHTVPELCAASKPMLHRVWGGVLSDRLWHLLRGDEIPDLVSARKTIGHSHVLPPDCRHPDKAWPILCKLLLLPLNVCVLACASCTDQGPPIVDVSPLGDGLKVIGYAVIGAAVLGVLGKLVK